MSSIREQLNILAKKGMAIPSKKQARRILRDNNYYNIINAYKDCFLDNTYIRLSMDMPDEMYKSGTSFNELVAMFEFDNKISEIYLKYFLQVENQFKTHLAYEFAFIYGEDAYFNHNNFDCSDDKIYSVLNLQSMINDTIYKNKNDLRVKHFYFDKNKNVPIWVLISLFEIGKARTFYVNCQDCLKKKVAYYYSLTPSQLISMISTINMFRNVCAHDSRLYCYRIIDVNKQISDMPVHLLMNINRIPSSNWFCCGKQDLYSAVIALKYLIDEESFNNLIDSLKIYVDQLNLSLHTISIEEVLNKMGFPLADSLTGQKNWDEIKNISRF